MHKPDLAAAIAQQTGMTRQTANEALTIVLDEITNALAFGRRVSLPGLGVIAPVQRAARTGVNPASRKEITIAAHRAVTFRAARKLKESVNS